MQGIDLFSNQFSKKEYTFRKQIMREFKKEENDFETLKEYNNYLETLEEFGTRVKETWNRIDQFKRLHSDEKNIAMRGDSSSLSKRKKLKKKLKISIKVNNNELNNNIPVQPVIKPMFQPSFQPRAMTTKRKGKVTKEMIGLRKVGAAWRDNWVFLVAKQQAFDLPWKVI